MKICWLVGTSALAFSMVVATGPRAFGQSENRILSITPECAAPGERVSIRGFGFGALNARIALGGLAAPVQAATGNSVTFLVPMQSPFGPTTVELSHVAGSQTGRAQFRVGCGYHPPIGVLLQGAPGQLASDAAIDLPPVGAGSADIVDGVILTRLAARLAPDATVAQVNAALGTIDAGIVTMAPRALSLTLAIPRQATIAGVQALAEQLAVQAGIRAAWPAVEVSPRMLPYYEPSDPHLIIDRFLLPGRFPAAWNAARLALTIDDTGAVACRRERVPVLIADFFGAEPSTFSGFLPQFRPPAAAPLGYAFQSDAGAHGYAVALTATSTLGANPFVDCLDVRLIQSAGFQPQQDLLAIANHMPATGKFIVNYSLGFQDSCAAASCAPASDRLLDAVDRAYDALFWKERTRARWPDFLMVVAAGNEKNDASTTLYPAMGDARYGSAMAMAAQADPQFATVTDGQLWGAPAAPFTTLAATPQEAASLAADVLTRQLEGPDSVATNVLLVGSTSNVLAGNVLSQRVTPEQLVESAFSDTHPDVLAVGEQVLDDALNGTSLAAPQVAGLASYLWLLSPELRDMPSLVTKQAIVANTRSGSIDAYATVLSLDRAEAPIAASAPVRLELLDDNGDGGFTETDIDRFLRHLFLVDSDGTITRLAPAGSISADFSRYDLNGDGFTTSGSRRDRFDLDRVGSVQFGATVYGFVGQQIEGQSIRYDEGALTDLDILCYYAYSGLYGGNPDARRTLLAGRCGLSVQPMAVTVNAGDQQQFTASAPVTWTAAGGSITSSGLFTAGTSAGTFIVRATSAADPATSVDASVTVNAPPPTTQIRGPYDGEEERGIIGLPTTTSRSRWAVQPVGAGFRIVRESSLGVYFCQPTGVAPFQCTPTFDLSGVSFSAAAGNKNVTGTIADGQVTFELEEPCLTNTSELVRCRTRFSGRLLTIQAGPPLLDFGSVPAGTPAGTQDLSITNLGLIATRVFITLPLGFSIVGNSCFSTAPTIVIAPEGTTCQVSVLFTPPLAGAFAGNVLIGADASAPVLGTVSVRGVGR